MATIPGTSGADTLTGLGSDDIINGLGGNDKIDGGAGNDQLNGGDGADIIKGGDGDDVITGGNGNDNIVGGAGRDTAVYTTAVAAASAGGTPIGTWSGALLTLATGGEGTDIVNQVETLRFNGMDFAVTGYNKDGPYNVVARLGADSAGGNQDAAITGNVLANDYDVDGRLAVTGVRVSADKPPAPNMPLDDPKAIDDHPGFKITGQFGTLSINGDGTYSYSATGSGIDHFQYSVTDGGVTRWVNLDITVNHLNHIPVAAAGSASGSEDTVLSGAVHATDADNDTLTFALVSGPAHGELDFHSDGTYSYTPDADYNGSDSFSFKANDGTVDSSPATVNLTVNPVNDAPVIDEPDLGGPFTDAFGSAWTLLGGNVVAGPGGSAVLTTENGLSLSEVAAATGMSEVQFAGYGDFVSGAIVDVLLGPDVDAIRFYYDLSALLGTNDKLFTVVPALPFINQASSGGPYMGLGGFHGFHVQFVLIDYTDDSAVGQVTLAGFDLNLGLSPPGAYHFPILASGPGEPTEDTAFSGHFRAHDVDGDKLAFSLADGHGPTHGSAVVHADGSFTYTPDANYHGSDSFQYQVSDGHGGTDTATYSFEVAGVNDAPVAADASASAPEDTLISGSVSASDADGDSLTYSLVSGPQHGDLNFNPDGSYSYTPDENYHGSDSFTFRANDGTVDSNTATISLDVDPPVNDAPVIDEAAAVATAATFVGGPGLAIDVNGHVGPVPGALTVGLISQSGSLYSDGAATAQQAADAAGVTLDFITGAGEFLGATIVTFNFDLMTQDQSLLFFAHFAPSSAGSGDFAIFNFGNFHLDSRSTFGTGAWDGGLNQGALSGLHGSMTVVLLDYAGDAGASRIDIRNLALVGTQGQTPLRASILGAPAEDNPFTGQFHASDAEGDVLTFSLVGGHGPAHGAAVVHADGSFSYTPDADYNGADSFDYQVSDGHGGLDTATYSFNVAAVNDRPTASFDVVHVDEEVTLSGTLSGQDIDGDTLTFTLTTAPGHGSLSLHSDGTYTYVPDANFNGFDFFYYTIDDGHGGAIHSNLSIQVDGTNDAPTVAADSGSGNEDNLINGQVHGTDVDGDSLTYELVGPAPVGLIFNVDGTWSFDPTGIPSLQALNFGQSGSASFSYRAYDGHLYSDAATVTVNVDGVNEPILGTAGKDSLTGTPGVDVLFGMGGDDTIRALGADDEAHGGDGADKLFGGDGDDQLWGDDGVDTINGEGGSDEGHGGAGADKLYGGDGDDQLWGDDGADTINGEGGGDTLFGGGDNDTLDGGDGDDFVYGDFNIKPDKALGDSSKDGASAGSDPSSNGADVVKGGAGNDHVFGGGGNDDVQGGLGDDFIYGGAGADRLSGGAGADVFIFQTGDLGSTLATSDTVTDFKASQGDWLDFSAIDAKTNQGGNQSFHITDSFTNHAGEMTVAFNAGINATVVSMDTNGDGVADYVLQLTGNVGSTAGWVL
jgi:VCBS repeat-containing protein